jgi:choline dehydrogenase-like flavoprotein
MPPAIALARPPVILIGLDAAEIDVVDRLVAAGRMPNLARLRQRGRWGRLQTEPPHFLIAGSSVFPSGGYANPTLTIVALAARLGDYLRRG